MVSPAVIWPAEHETALRALVLAGAGSHSIMADMLNAKFGTCYSRNALIGKVSRMGLRIVDKPHPIKKKPSANPAGRKVHVVAKPSPLKVDVSALRCVEVAPKNLELTDLSEDCCHWPYGEGPYTFCGHQAFEDSPYCLPHMALSRGHGTFDERGAHRLPREVR